MKLNFWQTVCIGLLVIIILLTGCNACQKSKIKRLEKDCAEKVLKVDTVTMYDTIEVPFDNIVYVPQPYKVEVEKPVPVYVEGKEVYLPVDTAAILKQFYATYFYSDKLPLQDSAGGLLGEVNIDEQISQNKIAQRKVTGSVQKQIETKYITKTTQAPRKNEFYLGIIGQGSKEVSMAVGASVLFVQKKGKFGIEGAFLLNTEGQKIYQGSFKYNPFKK